MSSEKLVSCPICGKQVKVFGLGLHTYHKHGGKQQKQQEQNMQGNVQNQVLQQSMPINAPINQPRIPLQLESLEHPKPSNIPIEEVEKPKQFTTKLVDIELTPISRPIKLSSAVLMYYDYAVSKGYEGDIGDFILECVVNFFQQKGIRLGFFRTVG